MYGKCSMILKDSEDSLHMSWRLTSIIHDLLRFQKMIGSTPDLAVSVESSGSGVSVTLLSNGKTTLHIFEPNRENFFEKLAEMKSGMESILVTTSPLDQ